MAPTHDRDTRSEMDRVSTSRRLIRALTGAVGAAWLLGAFLGPVAVASAAEPLEVSIAGSVVESTYPTLFVPITVIDPANGRPVKPAVVQVEVDDAAGPLTAVSVTKTPTTVPGAYVVVIDRSGSMGGAPLARAKAQAKAFVKSLDPRDTVLLMAFASGTEKVTPWLGPRSADLATAIDGLSASPSDTSISAAMAAASEEAKARPGGVRRFPRYGVVLFTDANPSGRDRALTSAEMERRLVAPLYVVSVQAHKPATSLDKLLREVANRTQGGFRVVGDVDAKTDPFTEIRASMRRGWRVAYRHDANPDGEPHASRIVVKSSDGASGDVSASIRSGTLGAVTTVAVQGLVHDEEITAERTVTFSSVGREWTSERLELFLDRDPDDGEPTASSDSGSLDWRLAVDALKQGTHTLNVRLTVSDGTNSYSTVVSRSFERRGTTLNLEMVSLTGGLALLMTAYTFIASRRRRNRA